jgi:hypothetical protein
MFDRVSQVAQALATGMSRRGFVGSIGRWAGATALAMAGVLIAPGTARAGSGRTCCKYSGYQVGCCGAACVKIGEACPPSPGPNCFLSSSYTVGTCRECRCP